MWELRWWCVPSVKVISKVEQKVLKFVLGGNGRHRREKDMGVDLVRKESWGSGGGWGEDRNHEEMRGGSPAMGCRVVAFKPWGYGKHLNHEDAENRDIWEQHGQDPNEGTWLVYWRKETREAEVEGRSLKIGYMVRETITWWRWWWRKRRRRRRKSWRNIRKCRLCYFVSLNPDKSPNLQLRGMTHEEAEVPKGHTTSTSCRWDWIWGPSDSNPHVLNHCDLSPLPWKELSPKSVCCIRGDFVFSFAGLQWQYYQPGNPRSTRLPGQNKMWGESQTEYHSWWTLALDKEGVSSPDIFRRKITEEKSMHSNFGYYQLNSHQECLPATSPFTLAPKCVNIHTVLASWSS